MQEKGFKWYAVRAVSGKEAKLKEYIEKECSHNEELAKHVAQVLLPMEKHAVLNTGLSLYRGRIGGRYCAHFAFYA